MSNKEKRNAGKEKEENVLQLRGLTVGYEQKAVVSAVDLQVKCGELIGIVGPNGAGKSTLVKTLCHQLPPLAGELLLFGRPAASFSAKDLARRAAYLQQNLTIPFDYSVQELVMTGRYPYLSWWQRESQADRRVVEASLAYTGMENFAQQSVNLLSGGQRQRVLLARTLAQQTPLLLLDEPATGLDLVYQEEMFHFCQDLCRAGKTVILVVHELGLAARFCSRLLLIGKGKLLADGDPQTVLTADRLTDVYDTPVTVCTNPLTGHMDIFSSRAKTDLAKEKLLDILLSRQEGERVV